MNSRERVLASFNHRSPDRVSLDYCAMPEVTENLIKHLNVKDCDELLVRLGVDFRHIDNFGSITPQYVGPELKTFEDGSYEDFWGCRRKKVEYQPDCFYPEWVNPPLADATTVHDIENYRWPSPDWFDFFPVKAFCQHHDEYCIAGGKGSTLDMVGFFRGMEQAMLDIHLNPTLVEAIVDKTFEFKYEYNRRLLEACEGRLDILFFGEDFASQNSLLFSLETLRKYVFPKFAKYSELARKYNALSLMHCDGDLHTAIPDLIECGVQIINPVQPNCPGMDPKRLKEEYGNDLCFHGLLDSQQLLCNATPDEVLAEAKRLIEVAGQNGGLALAPNCGFQVDVPIENILAIYDGL